MRDVLLCALVLVVSVGRATAAQIDAAPLADLSDHQEAGDRVLVSIQEGGETGGGLVRVSAASMVVARDSQEREAPSAPPSAQAAADIQAPVGALGALSSRVKPSDRIYVRKTSGEEIEGRFSRASDASLILEVDKQTREIQAIDVQQVSRRGGNRVKQGMLFGFLAGAAVAVSVTATSGSESDWSVGEKIVLATIAGGGTGLIWGAIIGAFVHKRPVVYRAAAPTVRVMPAFAPGRAGAMLAVRF